MITKNGTIRQNKANISKATVIISIIKGNKIPLVTLATNIAANMETISKNRKPGADTFAALNTPTVYAGSISAPS